MVHRSPPDHLTKEAQSWWEQLMEEFNLDDPGARLLLQTACECYDRMKQAQATVKKEGASFRDRFDQVKSHPLLVVERDARSQMILAIKSLNLDIEPLRDKPGRPGGR